jgi:riboflavin synthase
MFTGLVEGQGTISAIQPLPAGLRLSIVPDSHCFNVSEIRLGDSISISGCCLTVVSCGNQALDFEAGSGNALENQPRQTRSRQPSQP